MNQEYFDKVTELEKMNASDQYILVGKKVIKMHQKLKSKE